MTKRLHDLVTLSSLLPEAIDQTLKSVFKVTGTEVIYRFLENNFHLRPEEIAQRPEVFAAGIEKLLGSGAPVIEKLILKSLYSKLELQFSEKGGYSFSDYMKELRRGSTRG